MNKVIKSLVPPLIWDKLQFIRAYKNYQKYKKLLQKNSDLKGKHKGKRCFILGSGPSIKQEDLTPLKDEIVFALNNFYVHKDFPEIISGNEPKYYMSAPIHPPQTEDEWKTWFEDMETHIPNDTNMLFGLNAYDGNTKYIHEKYSIFQNHKVNWYFAGLNKGEYYQFNEKHIDLTQMVWSARTASVYALIAAVYMGFDEIYLLGMDHNQISASESDYRFYEKAIHQKNDKTHKSSNKSAFESLSETFAYYEMLNQSNSKIINLSTGSTIDIFEKDLFSRIIQS